MNAEAHGSSLVERPREKLTYHPLEAHRGLSPAPRIPAGARDPGSAWEPPACVSLAGSYFRKRCLLLKEILPPDGHLSPTHLPLPFSLSSTSAEFKNQTRNREAGVALPIKAAQTEFLPISAEGGTLGKVTKETRGFLPTKGLPERQVILHAPSGNCFLG